MKQKYIVGYCSYCRKETKHTIIQCTERLGWRIFENIFTFGAIAAGTGYDYKCECERCKNINTLHR